MIILPAIDILGGKCVRLLNGNYDSAEKVAVDPVETALEFERDGAEFIHMVDLDGARSGRMVNEQIYETVAKKVHIPIEVGGGIRNMETIDHYIEHGISRVIIGSAALTDPDLVKRAIDKYGDRIAIGIDALNRQVKTSGWLDETNVDYITLAKKMEEYGASYIIFTDISKDGTLSGPNFEQLSDLQKAVDAEIIASGGIKNCQHVKALSEMNLYGAICGKAIYTGDLPLRDAIRIGKKST